MRNQTSAYNSSDLFDDMSYQETAQQQQFYQPQHQQQSFQQQHQQQQQMNQSQSEFPGQELLNDPVASMAMQYGSAFVPAGKEFVEKKVGGHAMFFIRSVI